jgi:rhodanese-related sulfurtransferase/DNA-binding transcriptional ArsR family regulator
MGAGAKRTPKRRFKDRVYEAVSRVPAALANRHRLELLDLLTQRPRTVADLAAETELSVANASQHLTVLARSGLVAVRRRGRFAFYHVTNAAVYRLLVELRSVAESVDAEIAAAVYAYGRREGEELASFDAARELLARPQTAILDVRPPEEFAAAHLPGAISAPLDALRTGTVALPLAEQYVVYCRGPYCVFADEAVALLRQRGLSAIRLAMGPVEWVVAGGAVERAG